MKLTHLSSAGIATVRSIEFKNTAAPVSQSELLLKFLSPSPTVCFCGLCPLLLCFVLRQLNLSLICAGLCFHRHDKHIWSRVGGVKPSSVPSRSAAHRLIGTCRCGRVCSEFTQTP